MFRNAEQFQANRNLVDSETRGIRLVFHAKTALYLSKSLTEKEIEPKFALIEKIRIEGGFVRSATNFSMICSYIQEWITRYDLRSNYSPWSILKLAKKDDENINYIIDLVEASNENETFINRVIPSWSYKALANLYRPLLDRTIFDFIIKGIMPRYVANLEMNYLGIEDIQTIITYKRIYSNISNLDNLRVLRISNIEKLIRKRGLRTVFFNSDRRPRRIEVPLPFSIKRDVIPYF